ncbi:hypothetical protein P692DRAFT_20797033 [Suillus brevipes Sb2]|nr:hypothetical protein P692DRAFT_20797033 [Suillus brevipes Sb2]
MKKFANPERREDAPPDPAARSQVFESQQQQQQQQLQLQQQSQPRQQQPPLQPSPSAQQPPPNLPPKDDPQRPDDTGRQLAVAAPIQEDGERSRPKQRQAAAEDRGKQRAPAEPFSEDRTRQRPSPVDDRGKLRAPAELLSDDRSRQRLSPVDDRGKQRTPAELLPEDRDRTRQRPPTTEDRNRQRTPAEVQQSTQYNERSPLFTPPQSYAVPGPSRGYDAYSHRQPSPTGSDDILVTDNRTQPQSKPGFWARLTAAAKDRVEPEPANARTRGRLPPQPSRPNVVLFGERGAGKSSLINMLVGQDVSSPSNPSLAAFASRGYAVDVGGREVVVWDSVGLQKGEHHDSLSEGAARNLQGLIQNIHGGLNLLLFCVNATRVSEALGLNYDAFYSIIGSKKVPIVLVVTGLENKDPMEGWWREHEAEFERHGLTFDGHACITTTRGKPLRDGPGHWHDEQYEQSKLAVKELIRAKLGAAIIVREEGKLAELRELLQQQNGIAKGQNTDKGKNGWSLGETEGAREVHSGYGSTHDEQRDDDRTDRIEREGRTAALALLGGLFAVFVFLHSGVISCF